MRSRTTTRYACLGLVGAADVLCDAIDGRSCCHRARGHSARLRAKAMSAGASIESLPSDIQYIIARAFLPALCAVRACCKTLRAALWNSHLKSEAELWLYPEEVTLGTCELIATLPALERVIIAHGQWGGCGAVRQLGDWLLRIDVTALRTASSICIHPAVPKLRAACRYRDWAAGMDSCVWAVTLADENSLHRSMNAEVVGLLWLSCVSTPRPPDTCDLHACTWRRSWAFCGPPADLRGMVWAYGVGLPCLPRLLAHTPWDLDLPPRPVPRTL